MWPDDVVMGARFLWRLPAFLRNPVGLEEARAILRHPLERREASFLALVKRTIYEQIRSPYWQLLAHAGCEYRDLEKLVNENGVEGALHTLFGHGVYLTVDEFKGRRPVVRGSTTIAVDPRRLPNPHSALHFAIRSGYPGHPTSGESRSRVARDLTRAWLDRRSGAGAGRFSHPALRGSPDVDRGYPHRSALPPAVALVPPPSDWAGRGEGDPAPAA